MINPPHAPLADAPPAGDTMTAYDRDHLILYMRLLDAHAEGAAFAEIARILFAIDADAEPERARRIYHSHLGRARWMTENGYRALLRGAVLGTSPR